ncbi:MAG: hypothetical protein RL148_46 [Planctomycetota bacterium]
MRRFGQRNAASGIQTRVTPIGSRCAAPVLAALTLLVACEGPSVQLAAPAETLVLVDGRATQPGPLPFDHYGTRTLDAVPLTAEGSLADFARVPARTQVTLAEPVTPWLYPLDLPVEFVLRWTRGPEQAQWQAVDAPNPQPVAPGSQPADLDGLRQRAMAARSAR